MTVQIIHATGWTWEYTDDYTDLGRLQQFFRYWESSPPVHVSAARLAVMFGYKPAEPGPSPAAATPIAAAREDTGSILDMLSGDLNG